MSGIWLQREHDRVTSLAVTGAQGVDVPLASDHSGDAWGKPMKGCPVFNTSMITFFDVQGFQARPATVVTTVDQKVDPAMRRTILEHCAVWQIDPTTLTVEPPPQVDEGDAPDDDVVVYRAPTSEAPVQALLNKMLQAQAQSSPPAVSP